MLCFVFCVLCSDSSSSGGGKERGSGGKEWREKIKWIRMGGKKCEGGGGGGGGGRRRVLADERRMNGIEITFKDLTA